MNNTHQTETKECPVHDLLVRMSDICQTEMKDYPAHKMLREYRWLNDAHHTDDINNEFDNLLRQYQKLREAVEDIAEGKADLMPKAYAQSVLNKLEANEQLGEK